MPGDKHEISSTDKLIDLIKGSKEDSDGNTATGADDAGQTKPKVLKPIQFKPGKGSTVGVDIDETCLRVVKIIQKSSHDFVLDNYVTVPFPPGVSKESPGFSDFLRDSLERFGISNKDKVWCAMPSVGVEVGHVKIPKVPRSQIPNTVYFTVNMENPFDNGMFFLDFELQGEIRDNGVNKFRVLYYLARRSTVNEIKSIFAKAGIQITGLSLGPFLNQNFFRTGWVASEEAPTGALHIGRGWSRIDIFASGNLMLTRDIKAGLNSMVEALMEAVDGGTAGVLESGMSAHVGPSAHPGDGFPAERRGMNADQAWRILSSLSCESSGLQPDEPGYDLSDEEKFEMLRPAAERLVRQVERTFEYYTTTLGFERVRKIYVTGAIEGCRKLKDYIGEELGMEAGILDPMDPQRPAMAKVPPPDSLSERMSYTIATGLSLSDDSRTPNLIHPYEAKDKVARVGRFNKMIFICFLFIIIASGGYHLWQKRIENRKKETVAALQSEMAKYDVTVDRKQILSMVGALSKAKTAVEKVADRYTTVAVLGEVAQCTPEAIRILTAQMVLPPAKAGETKEEGKRSLNLEGLVLGDEKQFDTILAAYMVRLESSAIFRNPKIEKTEAHEYGEKRVLRFTLSLEVA